MISTDNGTAIIKFNIKNPAAYRWCAYQGVFLKVIFPGPFAPGDINFNFSRMRSCSCHAYCCGEGFANAAFFSGIFESRCESKPLKWLSPIVVWYVASLYVLLAYGDVTDHPFRIMQLCVELFYLVVVVDGGTGDCVFILLPDFYKYLFLAVLRVDGRLGRTWFAVDQQRDQ